jgi:hypothetical protein
MGKNIMDTGSPDADGSWQSQTSLFTRVSGDCSFFSLDGIQRLIVQFLLLRLLQVT